MSFLNKVKNPERQIKVILDSFDFHKVHVAMHALGWTWKNDPNRGSYLPDIEDLKYSATIQLKHIAKEYDGIPTKMGTGGFYVEVNTYGELGLSFRIDGGWYVPAEDGDIDYFGER